jgi:putative PIN family toxin of toxin-antitoxin system
LRFAFDTNVLISTLLLPDSIPARSLKAAENKGIVIYSLPVLEEIALVLSRPKFSAYIDDADIAGFLGRIHRAWEKIEIVHAIRACRDARDDKFLELAVNGKADFLVSGDKDLLALDPYQHLRIVTPAVFLKNFTEG